MARRKRLSPAQADYIHGDSGGRSIPDRAGDSPATVAPIAQVAGAAATQAALDELSGTLASARAEGRMIEELPLDAIDAGHLVRDRMGQGEEDAEALIASLKARGQQTPIEVVKLPEPAADGVRYGLVSGWRRLTALRQLAVEDPARFGTIRARLITPEDAQAAYVAMVEENEIRAGLSLYEKGRIALRAVQEGVYPTPRSALRGLYGAISASRRSKIGSFLVLAETFDEVLRFPTAIPERLGLALVKAVQEDKGFAGRVIDRLRAVAPDNAEAEQKLLAGELRKQTSGAPAPKGQGSRARSAPAVKRSVDAVFDATEGRIVLSGPGADAELFAALERWLKSRQT